MLGALREHDKLAAQLTQVGEIAQHLLDTNTRLEKEKKTADKELEDQREQIEALTEQLELAELAGLDDDDAVNGIPKVLVAETPETLDLFALDDNPLVVLGLCVQREHCYKTREARVQQLDRTV